MAAAGGSEVPLAVLRDQPSSATPAPPPAEPGSGTGQEKPAQSTAPAASAAPMGECSPEYRGLPNGDGGASMPAALPKVSMVPLVFIIFYEVSGGPFGVEDSVGAAGPLLAIAGFLLLPVIWSIPEALITAELGTMFPENGGYVVWVASALGPYWGFQQGWMKWLSGVIDNALYPVLFLDYLKSAVPALGGGAPRTGAVLGLTAVLTLLNYRGLTVVGWVAICVTSWLSLLGGAWLMWWVQAAAALSNMGMFVAEMSSDSYQLLGMAERGMLPAFFGWRSRYGTPLVGILFSASGVLLLSSMSFQEIVAAENFLYCFGMLLEFLAFVLLRVRRPDAPRPYRVPLGTAGCVAMLVPPTALIVVVLALSTLKVTLVSLGAVAVGLVLQPALRFVEKKGWLRFSVNSDLPDINATHPPAAADEPLAP
ncbi:hypothetical protein ACP70R_026381 [Stipagrostis hirtigluma subsp. patula]